MCREGGICAHACILHGKVRGHWVSWSINVYLKPLETGSLPETGARLADSKPRQSSCLCLLAAPVPLGGNLNLGPHAFADGPQSHLPSPNQTPVKGGGGGEKHYLSFCVYSLRTASGMDGVAHTSNFRTQEVEAGRRVSSSRAAWAVE